MKHGFFVGETEYSFAHSKISQSDVLQTVARQKCAKTSPVICDSLFRLPVVSQSIIREDYKRCGTRLSMKYYFFNAVKEVLGSNADRTVVPLYGITATDTTHLN
jgi:hypothetical protein